MPSPILHNILSTRPDEHTRIGGIPPEPLERVTPSISKSYYSYLVRLSETSAFQFFRYFVSRYLSQVSCKTTLTLYIQGVTVIDRRIKKLILYLFQPVRLGEKHKGSDNSQRQKSRKNLVFITIALKPKTS